MDLGELLHKKMFDADSVEEFLKQLRGSINYTRRHRKEYEKFFGKSLEELHYEVRKVWQGRMTSGTQTEALELWYSNMVQPCLSVEPGKSIKQKALNDLLKWMQCDPTCSGYEIAMVKDIVTGELFRHPALQGILVACSARLQQLKSGAATMRNAHRALFLQRRGGFQGFCEPLGFRSWILLGISLAFQIEACQWSNMVDPRAGRSKSCAEVR